ncbi:FAD:protein FMN transferase [Nocardioides bruguierae]|uniref:FAD:protein FMN transferase n=1 Tax=Nocardioides bruguierae TaxID=2945102 RepID=UPI0020202FD6|nr:FAD:protein FMN transferase [Nocardioides bruguierae]MCL8026113.1 FAD:protein FMN transferase [Nocardioides bruguierae]
MSAHPTTRWSDWSCSVVVTCADERDLPAVTATVRTLMADVDRAVSRFRDDSDLARVNAAAGRLVPVRPLTLALVEVGVAAARATDGAVDPTLAADLVALGYDADIAVVRGRPTGTAHQGQGGERVIGWHGLRSDPALRLLGVPAGTGLDLGSTAKAWTVDEAVRRGARRAHAPFLVSIGGDVAAHGSPDGGWTISVEETEDTGGGFVTLHDGGLATSSTAGRRWAGVHHLIDPRTGRSATGAFRTATVWASTCLAANTRSTWLLVDTEAALAAAPLPTRLVDSRGHVHTRDGWPDEPRHTPAGEATQTETEVAA